MRLESSSLLGVLATAALCLAGCSATTDTSDGGDSEDSAANASSTGDARVGSSLSRGI
jgi:hypothetical protein